MRADSRIRSPRTPKPHFFAKTRASLVWYQRFLYVYTLWNRTKPVEVLAWQHCTLRGATMRRSSKAFVMICFCFNAHVKRSHERNLVHLKAPLLTNTILDATQKLEPRLNWISVTKNWLVNILNRRMLLTSTAALTSTRSPFLHFSSNTGRRRRKWPL